jgi:hypothetical protein
MDPFLEDRRVWPGFHHSLAEEIRGRLNEQIGPKYYADVEVNTSLEDVTIAVPRRARPDVSVIRPMLPADRGMTGGVAVAELPREEAPVRRAVMAQEMRSRTVKIFLTGSDELVTAIEILSPANKQGEGLSQYRQKRADLLRIDIHFVEIDLLRGGERPGPEVANPPLDGEYVLLVNRSLSGNPDRVSEIWPVSLDQPLPTLPIPLLEPDPDALLAMQAAIRAIYKRAGYSWRIDYAPPAPDPPLSAQMDGWMVELLANRPPTQPQEAQTITQDSQSS